MTGVGSYHGAARRLGYGAGMKKKIREGYGASIGFAGLEGVIRISNSQ